jgi:putative transposase
MNPEIEDLIAGAGLSTAEVCRRHGISTATFYGWKAKFGGMEVSEAKRLKQLENENAKLKRLLADAMLDNASFRPDSSFTWRKYRGSQRSIRT